MSISAYIIAVENSGDQLGAQLAASLLEKHPDIKLMGIGGSAMVQQGIRSEIDISGLAILGFSEGLKSYPMILNRVRQTVQSIISAAPNAVILIDSWGFMIRVAKGLKKAGFEGKVIKFVAPQVWAMREGRAKILAKYVDYLLTIHSFDAPYFEPYGLDVRYVGNPVFDTNYRAGDGATLRRELSIDAQRPVVSVYLGSRHSELFQLLEPFLKALTQLRQSHPDVIIISPMAGSLSKDITLLQETDSRLKNIIFLPEARKLDVFSASDVALACSGTVTTQLACAGVPTVVAYRLKALTYIAAKRLYKPDYISIINIAAGQALMPEYIQGNVTGDNLCADIQSYLDDSERRISTSQHLIKASDKLKGKGGLASERAALAVLDILRA